MRQVYLNGQFVVESEARISVFDRAVLFADAVYEVISVLDGKLIDMERHIERLERSLHSLAVDAQADWTAICRHLVASNALQEGIIYLQVSRGAADRDFLFPPEGTLPTIFAFTQARNLTNSPLAEKGMRIILRGDLRWQRREIKTTQLLFASMMKMEARAQGVDDCWLMEDGFITEGTSQNAWIIDEEGVLRTHRLDNHILWGVTRASVTDIASKAGLVIEERAFTPDELYRAKEAFVTAATMFVTPVVEAEGRPIGDGLPGTITRRLREAYIAACRA